MHDDGAVEWRGSVERLGDSVRLTDAQFHKLTCIAQAGGFWERER